MIVFAAEIYAGFDGSWIVGIFENDQDAYDLGVIEANRDDLIDGFIITKCQLNGKAINAWQYDKSGKFIKEGLSI